MINPRVFDVIRRFPRTLEGDIISQEAISIARQNSRGKMWMIGGGVFRSLVSALYGTSASKADRDFIAEEVLESPYNLPEGWVVAANSNGNPKFVLGDKSIDLVPLGNIHSIIARGLEPSMENYLTGTPLNIQSMFYDFEVRKVMGDKGIHALIRKAVAINNMEEAVYGAKSKGMVVEEYLKKYAEELNFTVAKRP